MTPPLLIAALVLCSAAAMKLRSPGPATRAISQLGLPASRGLIRAVAVVELVLGGWVLASPAVPVTAALACAYAAFAGVAALLARRRASCGCFGGEDETPASLGQALISATFALVATVATIEGAHGAQWVLDRQILDAATLMIGTVAAAYATVLAYTELPRAWASWSAR